MVEEEKSILNKLVFEINNFGAINKSKIRVNQINIIAGANSSGKSTASKILYSFLISLSKEGKSLADHSINDKFFLLVSFVRWCLKEDQNNINKELKDLERQLHPKNYKYIIDVLSDIYKNNFKKENKTISDKIKNLKEIIDINESDDKYKYIIKEILDSEFKNEYLDKNFEVKFSGNFSENPFQYSLNSKDNKLERKHENNHLMYIIPEVVYIDSLSILDSHRASPLLIQQELNFDVPFNIISLSRKLKSKKEIDVYENEFFPDLTDLKEELKYLINGVVEFDIKSNEFVYKTNNKNYHMSNTSSGIKQIGILQILLNKNVLKDDSFVLMDEPEVNLHPEWQVNIAKFIVQLAKQSNITFYINSHSPFFIEAIEVYSEYYNMSDKTNFYLSKESENGMCNINKIEVEDLDEIYDNLGDPFNTLSRIRFKNRKEQKT